MQQLVPALRHNTNSSQSKLVWKYKILFLGESAIEPWRASVGRLLCIC